MLFHYFSYHEKTKRGKSGKKGFEYNEEGSFRKGHSTKGKHVIHKLNEFENKKKFFDEDYDHEFDEKYDDFYVGNGSKQGRTFKRGHQEDLFQQSGRLGKGFTKNSKDSRNESGLIDIFNFGIKECYRWTDKRIEETEQQRFFLVVQVNAVIRAITDAIIDIEKLNAAVAIKKGKMTKKTSPTRQT